MAIDGTLLEWFSTESTIVQVSNIYIICNLIIFYKILSRYLLKFATDHAPTNIKECLQRKLIRGNQKAPHAREFPPNLLEWRGVRQKCNTALTLTLPDKTISTVNVDSWTTCEEVSKIM